MRIAFVKPSMVEARGGDALEPLAFGILAALTPGDVELRLYDERIEPIDFGEPADLVAISCDTYSARRSYQIAAEYGRRGAAVVIGGWHPTLVPDEALKYVGTVVAGDGEDTWPAVVEDARKGKLKRLYQSRYPALSGVRVDRSIFAGKNYGPMRLVQVGRGCCNSCDFCSIHALYGSQVRYRPIDEVVEEIEAMKARSIIFTDDNLFANKAFAIQLLRRLEPLGIRWASQTTLDIAEDEELLRLLARSGCMAVVVGLESLRDDTLAQMRKNRFQTANQYARWIERIHRRGIMVYGSFIFGYDHDTPADFAPSLEFVVRRKLFMANFNPLIPMPGTALYERLKNEGRLIRDPWWLDADYRYGTSPFHPRGMTADELTDNIFWIRKQFNGFASIAGRGLNWRANMRNFYHAGAYVACNLINRREIYRKQGLRLGAPDLLEPIVHESARA